jgi:hypothetical protein
VSVATPLVALLPVPRLASCRPASVVALAFGLCFSHAAQAGLGDPVDSVLRDHDALRGTALKRTPMAAFDVHEITTEHGIDVREYVSRQGTVFATTWSGPALPDLKVVLGARYPLYAAGAQALGSSHKVFSMSTEGIVLRVVKLPRGFAGSAHVPALLPPGTSVDDIR